MVLDNCCNVLQKLEATFEYQRKQINIVIAVLNEIYYDITQVDS